MLILAENVEFILSELEIRIKKNRGASNVVQQPSRNLENWLQVELCDILFGLNHDLDIIVENRMGDKYCDVYANEFAIQMKVLLAGQNDQQAGRLATLIGSPNGDSGLIPDIEMLKDYDNEYIGERAVVFVVYPAQHNNAIWALPQYRGIVEDALGEQSMYFREFYIGDTGVVLYFAIISNLN